MLYDDNYESFRGISKNESFTLGNIKNLLKANQFNSTENRF